PLPPGAIARIGTVRLRHGDGVWTVAFSPDGKTIASGGLRFNESICLWKASTGRRLSQLDIHPRMGGGVMSVAFSPDGKTLASGSYNPNLLCLWDLQTGQRLHTSKAYEQGVTSVAFSPDGRRVVSGGYDKTIRIFDPATGMEQSCLT